MEINIRTETRTTIDGTAILDNGCFKVPIKVNYDGAEERFRTINFEKEIKGVTHSKWRVQNHNHA